ncbi:hypothetical protein BKA82DRAFT_25909 [Pisolithus tinctorius]|uniref:Uncharacterized protein n=1 Tax=Pisolithus tinctorius Marx 270 TaxID=870435 RepID=A0A0C3NVE1_PISTI|nr:hypothetical protein BKA82DRAFT_25909 [Pisolithus tinctorius]KIO04825.1 hypothetical protein M404DRAFT_25909 [Pisolithus tinctorius Marx 270]
MAPTITMASNDIIIDVDGFVSEWDTYSFSLDIASPGKKRIVIRLKHPNFLRCAEVESPYVQAIQLEDIAKLELDEVELPSDEQLKLESVGEVKLESNVSEVFNASDSVGCTVLPCHMLPMFFANPDVKTEDPNALWRYYIRTFDWSLLPHELGKRKGRSLDATDEKPKPTKRLKSF